MTDAIMSLRSAEEQASWAFNALSEADSITLATALAKNLQRGDLIALKGDLGAGKSFFARALIRAFCNDADLDVPSPSFTLMQTYETDATSILHCDFYRVIDPEEVVELGFDELTHTHITFVEWAERVPAIAAQAALTIELSLPLEGALHGRNVVITTRGDITTRLAPSLAVMTMLSACGWLGADQVALAGDASGRHFERLTKDTQTAILMHAPAPPAGPLLRNGKTYRATAHLSDSLSSFIAVADGLREQHISAPLILAADRDRGLALVEDFGQDLIAVGQDPIKERYQEALNVLARLHAQPLPQELRTSTQPYLLPSYDLEALLVEVELCLDWYLPVIDHVTPTEALRKEFLDLWRNALAPSLMDKRTWTLRDYHSPNLFWLKDRQGDQRIGVIDIQDMVYGHPAYDVASLLQDARVTIPESLELDLMHHYAETRLARDAEFALEPFITAYALYAAQRATKILGIFVRLDRRDQKPGYIPRLSAIRHYLKRNLAHPALRELEQWFIRHAPSFKNSDGM